MGKQDQENETVLKNKTINEDKRKKSGRPSNLQIETTFLNIIRETKLQSINAESQLELEMAFFTTEQDKKIRRKEESSLQQKLHKILEFTSLTSQQKKNLLQIVENQRKKWKFNEIEKEDELPDYFFDHENDLAFILYNLIIYRRQLAATKFSNQNKQNIENIGCKIKAEELFFVALLCLNFQDSFRDVVLDFVMKKELLIINLLKASMQKVVTKYKQRIKKVQQNERSTSQIEQLVSNKSQDLPYEESIYEGSQNSKKQSKKIKKPEKVFKKSLKQNKYQKESQQEDEPILTQKQKQQKLILCFINYISWSYFYIYSEQQKSIKDSAKTI